MNIDMNGKEIAQLDWPGGNQPPLFRVGGIGKLYLSATYHGDHDEFWIVQVKDGKEVARHNPRFIGTIIWADDV